MNYKLTIDRNLTSDTTAPGMEKLRRWMSEGKIHFLESGNSTYNWPGLPPRGTPSKNRGAYKPKSKSNATFREIAAILFSSKDSQKLAMGEVNEIVNLVQHLESHNEFFVTMNHKVFLDEGRRDRLKRSLGIIAMTPEEAVAALSQLEGWK